MEHALEFSRVHLHIMEKMRHALCIEMRKIEARVSGEINTHKFPIVSTDLNK